MAGSAVPVVEPQPVHDKMTLEESTEALKAWKKHGDMHRDAAQEATGTYKQLFSAAHRASQNHELLANKLRQDEDARARPSDHRAQRALKAISRPLTQPRADQKRVGAERTTEDARVKAQRLMHKLTPALNGMVEGSLAEVRAREQMLAAKNVQHARNPVVPYSDPQGNARVHPFYKPYEDRLNEIKKVKDTHRQAVDSADDALRMRISHLEYQARLAASPEIDAKMEADNKALSGLGASARQHSQIHAEKEISARLRRIRKKHKIAHPDYAEHYVETWTSDPSEPESSELSESDNELGLKVKSGYRERLPPQQVRVASEFSSDVVR